ncbi:MAG: PKD domain-containing protein [Candidatus Bipolaricaulota bacterium]|nr:MAG: PKD domain-containing protein [Candidatus Bipolaricaulota bacterium]
MSRTRVLALLASGLLLACALSGCLNPITNPPQALFSVSLSEGETPFTTSFNATLSFDPDGQIVAYQWDFGDGTTGSGPVTSHEYTKNGEFVVRLTVVDNSGATAAAEVDISAQNPVPSANFEYKPRSTLPDGTCFVCRGEKVTFEASASDDGYIVTYEWDFGDGERAEGEIVTHSFQSSGVHMVTLTVTDDDGGKKPVTHPVTVEGGDPCGGGTCVGDICLTTDTCSAPLPLPYEYLATGEVGP